MNAVIVDIRGRHAAALREDGTVVQITNQGYALGQRLDLNEIHPSGVPRVWKRALSGAVAAALVIVAGTGTAYAMPYGTVTLDTDSDSSLVYTINCFDYVLDVKGGNESGEALLLDMDTKELRHRPVGRAVSETVERLEKKHNGGRSKHSVRITASARGKRHTEKLQNKLKGFSSSGEETDGVTRPNGGGRKRNGNGNPGVSDKSPGDSSGF